jgi:hypothetical protein
MTGGGGGAGGVAGGAGGMAGAGGGMTGGGGGVAGAGGGAGLCVWGDDCGPGYYCNAPGCGVGACAPLPPPVGLSPDKAPVCGCDGYTYWNSDIAAWLGAAPMSAGVCQGAAPCGPGSPCPGLLRCNRAVADAASCANDATGTCWGMPNICDLAGPKGRGCIGGTCELECSLVQGQNPWHPDPTCL